MAGDCDYCRTTELVYEMHPMRGGTVHRCIECLALEQGQKQFDLPFDAWLDREDIEAPDVDPFDPREHSYKTARAWFTVLARLQDDDPIVKRDPEAIGTIFESVRESLINLMGEDAYKQPSELRGDAETVELSTEHAETLLEAAGTVRDDIAGGRQWGHDQEDHEDNAGDLDDAHDALRERLEGADDDE